MKTARVLAAVILLLVAVIASLATYIVVGSFAQPPWVALVSAAGAFISVTTAGAAVLTFIMGGK